MARMSEEQKQLFDKLKTKLQKEVALFYIKNDFENGASAYLKACKKIGKKPANNHPTAASQILNDPNVLAFLDSVRKPKEREVAEDAIGTFEQKRKVLWDVVQICSQNKQITNAQGVPEYVFDARAVTGAIGELNKMDGDLAAQKVNHKVIDITDMDEQQLESRLALLERELEK